MVANGQSDVATRLKRREGLGQFEGTPTGGGASAPVSRGRALQQATSNAAEHTRTDMDASPGQDESDATGNRVTRLSNKELKLTKRGQLRSFAA